MKILHVALLVCFGAALAFGQQGHIDGTITDPTGAAVPGAEITATQTATHAVSKATSNEKGEWTITQLDAGTYTVSIAKPGFKVSNTSNIALAAGSAQVVLTKLEVGQATETVTVTGGAEVVNATSADITSTLTGRQVTELPFATRNAVELMVTQPGTATPTNPRSSTINGLPKGAINITIDGINTQDNYLKSSDGFFSYIMPSVDSLEEVTLTTSAAGADSTAQGAAQIKFVTKSGTNQFHGGGFYQFRNTFFNSNYYFNNELAPTAADPKGLPRDILHLRQYGGHIGGPIIKDKLFFFGNVELFRNPSGEPVSTSVAYPTYTQGLYNYADTAGNIHQVNLFQIAASGNAALPAGTRAFATTIDPIVQSEYSLVASITPNPSTLPSNAGSNDYNSAAYNFQVPALDERDFYTGRIDYNLSQKNHLSLTYDYDHYFGQWDLLNGVYATYPGQGVVLGSSTASGLTGQFSRRFVGTIALRSAITARLTNELRMGLDGGTVSFELISPSLYAPYRGYNFSESYIIQNRDTGPSARNAPYKEVGDNVSWVKGTHQITAGFSWERINFWQESFGSESFPSLSFGAATGDPLNTGTGPFNVAANFPNASSSQISSMTSAYASLTGRISSINTRQTLSETTHQYSYGNPAIDRDQEGWYGLFAQDTWRALPNLTITVGLRLEKEETWKNLDGLYSNVTNPSIWGLSGVGNLFNPGVENGVVPTFTPLTGANTYNEPAAWAPSVGVAWQIPASEGPLGILFGHHQGASVFRAGYNISTTREGSAAFQGAYGSNTGLTQPASVSYAVDPKDFGPVGGVLFRDPTLPTYTGLPTTEVFPIASTFSSRLYSFDPELKLGYVQSWNFGFQREIDRNTVVEIRYTGNHGLHEWEGVSWNEVNTVNNGFQQIFAAAANNLLIARGGSQYSTATSNFANQGLPGQVAIPFLQAAYGTTCCNSSSIANYLAYGQLGSMASNISSNTTYNSNFIAAGYPANYFVANPSVAGGGVSDEMSWGSSYYDSGQVELRRRLSAGMQFQLNYSYSKSLGDSGVITLRDTRMDKVPDGFDIRQAFKANYIYELPFGAGRHYLSGVSNKAFKKALEGWEVAGVVRVQSGVPIGLSGYSTVDGSGSGVVLHNITLKQLQSEVGIVKTQNPVSPYVPQVYYLPKPVAPTGLTSSNNTNLIDNTWAAFGNQNLTPAQVDPSAPYISAAAPGQWGCICNIYSQGQKHFDVSLIKVTHIRESVTLEFRAQALNVFNIANFLPGSSNSSSSFGTVGSAYRDISGTFDPGGRILEFVGRLNF